jgi:ubiquinone/menaquinone biosynthesis C-methylase UbiE
MDKYRWIGPAYGLLCKLYGGTAYERCRVSTLHNLTSGQKVLFVGVGHGEDAIFSALSGASVTVVELSPTMLNQFQMNLAKNAPNAVVEMIQSDIMAIDRFEQYDVVVANFFLNIFDLADMQTALKHIARLAKSGGSVVISDFALPHQNGWLQRSFKTLYWYLANSIFWVLAQNPVHPIFDYRRHLVEAGMDQPDVRYTSFLWMDLFWSMRAAKPHVTA